MKIGGIQVCFAIGLTLVMVLTACGNPVRSMETSMQEIPDYELDGLIPELTVPEGMQEVGGGGGGGNYAAVTGIFFIGDLPLADVENHFTELLSAAGWRYISRQESQEETIVFWELTDRDGGIWSGRLMVAYNPPGFQDTYMAEVGILLPQ